MQTLLTDAPAKFARFKKELLKSAIYESEKSSKTQMSVEKQKFARNASFWSFARESMFKMQAQMEEHLLVLTSEIPKCHIDVKTCKAMNSTF